MMTKKLLFPCLLLLACFNFGAKFVGAYTIQSPDTVVVDSVSTYAGDSGIRVPVYGWVGSVGGEDLDAVNFGLSYDTSALVCKSILYDVSDAGELCFYDSIPSPFIKQGNCYVDSGWATMGIVFSMVGDDDIPPGHYRMFDIVFDVKAGAAPGCYVLHIDDEAGLPPIGNYFTHNITVEYFEKVDGSFTVLGHYGTISGNVSNAVTSEPIGNATVKAGSDSTTTNASGEYSLDVLVGSIDVICSASGYDPDTFTVAVTEDETITVDFSLTPHYGSIGGTVADSEFVPIFGAVVSAGGKSDVTGAGGSYLIDNLLIGTYTVTATASGYYGGVKSGIEVQEGEVTTVDFLLARQRLASPVNLEAISGLDSHVPLDWESPYSGISILLVDDDGSSGTGYADVCSYFTDALDSAGYVYDYLEVEYPDNGPDSTVLRDYDVVIWFTGETYGNHPEDTMTPDDEANLAAYLRSGGKLFLSSLDYFRDRYPGSGAFNPGDFPYDYLQIDSTYQDYWWGQSTGLIYGMDGSIAEGICFASQDPFTTTKDGLYVDRLFHRVTDLLEDFPGLIPPPYTGICALQYDSGIYRLVFTAFPFPGLVDSHTHLCSGRKVRLMHNIIQFLAYGEVGEGGLFLSYNLYRGDSPGFEPSPSNLIASLSPLVTTYDDTSVTNGLTYYYKVTALYEGGESDPSNEVSAIPWVAHNPEPFSLLSPADGDTVWQLSVILTWHQTTDPDPGDTLTYSLFWDTEPGFSHPDSLSDLADTSATIDLSDETTYWWKVKAVDTNTSGRWSEETFHFTTYYPEPPEEFSLIYPQDGDTNISMLPTLIWQPAPDPDTGDRITYSLVYSTHSDFSDSVMIPGLDEDTSYTFTDSLKPETDYYWKVYASDRFALTTECESPYHFTTGKTGVLVITSPEVPRTYSLSQNFPNPFNPLTQIRYALPKPSRVSLLVYNILGEEIAALIDAQQEPGYYRIVWDGRDELGRGVCSGIYFYRLRAGDFISVKRMVLIR